MYDIGDPYPLTITTKDADGDPADADSVSVVFTLPDQTTAGPFALARRSLGVYEYDYVTTVEGLYSWHVTVVGADVLGAQTDVFNVDGPASSFPLLGLDEAKAHLNIAATVHDDDEELRRMIVSASALVEAETRLWRRRTVAQELDPRPRLYLTSRPVISVTSVVQDGATLTGYELSPIGDVLRATAAGARPWSGTGKVTVTYEAGETIVPPPVREAVLLTIAEIWKSQRGPVRSPLRGGSGYEDPDAEPSIAYALPYGAQKLIEPWARGPLMA